MQPLFRFHLFYETLQEIFGNSYPTRCNFSNMSNILADSKFGICKNIRHIGKVASCRIRVTENFLQCFIKQMKSKQGLHSGRPLSKPVAGPIMAYLPTSLCSCI